MKEHCPHETGTGTRTSFSMSRDVKCCNCGEAGYQVYTFKAKQIEGHGPHFKQRYMELESTTWHGKEECIVETF